MKCASLLVLAVILGAAEADAATIQAASCNQADVAAAINSVSDGDTVVIPAGTCTWLAGISVNESITIRGAGVGATVITSGIAGGSTWRPLVTWATKATGNSPAGFARLTGITFSGGASGGNAPNSYMVVVQGNSGNVRVDHNQFINSRSRGMAVLGYVRGVIDHNSFNVNQFGYFALVTRHGNWASDSEGFGDRSWASPLTPGSREAIYVEDNTFINGTGNWNSAHDGDYGHRVVFRNNTYRNIVWSNHGTETDGRPRGARWSEHYRNQFVGDNPALMSSFPSVIGSRSGSHMVFDNRMTFTNGASATRVFDMATYRAADSSKRGLYVWGRCGVRPVTLARSGTTVTATSSSYSGVCKSGSTIEIVGAGAPFDGIFRATNAYGCADVANGSGNQFTYETTNSGSTSSSGSVRAPWDANADANGYRCLDQIGAGSGALITGAYPSPVRGGHQALEPVYIWNNLRDADTGSGTNYQLSPGAVNQATNVIVANRDYYNQSTSFTGASGVGRGPIGMRPGSCTPGVAYWATDEGEWDSTNGSAPDGRLYKCTSANNWTLFYTPYIYPHHLVSGAAAGESDSSSSIPQSPTNLRIVGQ